MNLHQKLEAYGVLVKTFYNRVAEPWSLENRNPVVGSFDAHNAHADYDEFLFKNIPAGGRALDFACGVGRNMVKFWDRFDQVEGTDISPTCLDKARQWLDYNHKQGYALHEGSGYDLSVLGDNQYDVVFSTIAFQHIGVYAVRLNYLREFWRILKPGGHVAIQMGYGFKPGGCDYFENNWDQPLQDTRVSDVEFLRRDLEGVGFTNFEFDIRPVGPGDNHSNWIFFRASK
jgi:ubiquinone/menaquinone biosynthesis C-methylase UbiE